MSIPHMILGMFLGHVIVVAVIRGATGKWPLFWPYCLLNKRGRA
jgi:hypothetical protein